MLLTDPDDVIVLASSTYEFPGTTLGVPEDVAFTITNDGLTTLTLTGTLPFGVAEQGVGSALVDASAVALGIGKVAQIGANANEAWTLTPDDPQDLLDREDEYKQAIQNRPGIDLSTVTHAFIESDSNEAAWYAVNGSTPEQIAKGQRDIDLYQKWTYEVFPSLKLMVLMFRRGTEFFGESLELWTARQRQLTTHMRARTVDGTPLPAMILAPECYIVDLNDPAEDGHITEMFTFAIAEKLEAWGFSGTSVAVTSLATLSQVMARRELMGENGVVFWGHNASPETDPPSSPISTGQLEIFEALAQRQGYPGGGIVAVSGTDFTITNQPGQAVLAPDEFTTFTLRFFGLDNATETVSISNDAGGPFEFDVQGLLDSVGGAAVEGISVMHAMSMSAEVRPKLSTTVSVRHPVEALVEVTPC